MNEALVNTPALDLNLLAVFKTDLFGISVHWYLG